MSAALRNSGRTERLVEARRGNARSDAPARTPLLPGPRFA